MREPFAVAVETPLWANCRRRGRHDVPTVPTDVQVSAASNDISLPLNYVGPSLLDPLQTARGARNLYFRPNWSFVEHVLSASLFRRPGTNGDVATTVPSALSRRGLPRWRLARSTVGSRRACRTSKSTRRADESVRRRVETGDSPSARPEARRRTSRQVRRPRGSTANRTTGVVQALATSVDVFRRRRRCVPRRDVSSWSRDETAQWLRRTRRVPPGPSSRGNHPVERKPNPRRRANASAPVAA